MTIFVNATTGDISFFKGDSGNLMFSNLPTDRDYTFYFAILKNRDILLEKSIAVPSGDTTVAISLGSAETDTLQPGTYEYGAKLCATSPAGQDEITVIPRVLVSAAGVPTLQPAPKCIVYAKRVEGTAAA